MRHRKKYSTLGLTTNQRKALLKGLTISLLEHGAIVTTKARAKQLRAYAERIISKVKKEDEAHARRLVFRKLQSKFAVKKLFDEYKEDFVNRPGGYTRIHLLGNRPGDAAEMARISLVLGPSAKVEEEAEKQQKTEAKAEKPVKKAKTAKKAESKPVKKIEASEEVEAKVKGAEVKAKSEKPAKKKVTKTDPKPAENDQKAE